VSNQQPNQHSAKPPNKTFDGKILDGKVASSEIFKKLHNQAIQLKRPPGLAVIQVGNNPASNTYIGHKQKACNACGFRFVQHRLSQEINLSELIGEIKKLSVDPSVDGIIVQLPLDSKKHNNPADVQKVLAAIPPQKDADGLSIFNQGMLFAGESTPHNPSAPIPATPLGVYRLLEHYKISVSTKNITVIGRSRLVGFPVAGLMSQAGATVSVCHRGTADITPFTQMADIVIAAAGSKHLIVPQHIKEGAVLIDVGIHIQENGKLTGDIHPDCYAKASAYSPVPGGVGPMTVASLMENTLHLAQSQLTGTF